MSKSIKRVQAAAEAAELSIEIKRMGESTRTAEEAARQCGCTVAQIVKSLIFQGEESDKLYLFLVSGDRQLDIAKASALVGDALKRADPRHIRDVTGFAIGGVSPLGQPDDVARYGDQRLLDFEIVWAAAGAHDAVFSAEPERLFKAAGVEKADIST
ncbi:YbaK/EbsC family protein [uncultured Nitratireductor sp.]|uniref:YbaK/EbsC family protein n=1 Tax=uncultured Nitratireductor sp. TaxID=520953 RepID=UPI0025CCE138|nr:YbaK/EbsC family protein [uncultured Nitratireductor sp.]